MSSILEDESDYEMYLTFFEMWNVNYCESVNWFLIWIFFNFVSNVWLCFTTSSLVNINRVKFKRVFLCSVWYPFLCGDEASFVVSNKELESLEVLVFDSSGEVLGGEMILFRTSHKIVELVDKFGSKFLRAVERFTTHKKVSMLFWWEETVAS